MACFNGLGFLDPTDQYSKGLAISPTLRNAFGSSLNAQSYVEAFRWPPIQGLGDLPPNPPGGAFDSCAHASSIDGSVVVGRGDVGTPPPPDSNSRQQAFRWDGSMLQLPWYADDRHCAARDVDDNGQIIVGRSWTKGGRYNAVVWSPNSEVPPQYKVTKLADLPSNSTVGSMAYAISGDRAMIVGKSNRTTTRNDEAVYWEWNSTNSTWGQCTTLHQGGGGAQRKPAKALAVSEVVPSDLRIIVGQCRSSGAGKKATCAFRYSLNVRKLELLVNEDGDVVVSQARDVSGNGSVIVGDFETSGNERAFVWFTTPPPNTTVPARTMVEVSRVLSELTNNQLPPAGWALSQAQSVSRDGAVIVGLGRNPQGNEEGWIASV